MSFDNKSRPNKIRGICRFCNLNIFKRSKGLIRDSVCGTNCRNSYRILTGVLKDPLSAELIEKYNKYGGSIYTTILWLRLRHKVFEKHGKVCAKCGSVHRLNIDHIKPISWGQGLYFKEDNMQVLCFDCNMSKGTTMADYRKPEVAALYEGVAEKRSMRRRRGRENNKRNKLRRAALKAGLPFKPKTCICRNCRTEFLTENGLSTSYCCLYCKDKFCEKTQNRKIIHPIDSGNVHSPSYDQTSLQKP